MDNKSWTVLPQNPPNPNLPIDAHSQFYTSHYPYYSHQPQNPNPNPVLNVSGPQPTLTYESGLAPGLMPPATDSYASTIEHPPENYIYQALPDASYGYQTAGTAPVAYYHDQNAQNWVASAASITLPSNGTEQLVTAYSNTAFSVTPTVHPHGSGTWRKGPKKTKIVQSAWCEVCKVDCNSKDVLELHKLGKKHKKNLEKLNGVNVPAANVSAASNNPIIGPQENPDKVKVSAHKNKKKTTETVGDLETKRRKVVESGAAVNAVRVCTLCNVVCNSETVFNYHIAGQKHAALLKKHAAGTGGITTS